MASNNADVLRACHALLLVNGFGPQSDKFVWVSDTKLCQNTRVIDYEIGLLGSLLNRLYVRKKISGKSMKLAFKMSPRRIHARSAMSLRVTQGTAPSQRFFHCRGNYNLGL